jgi:hypothetical protein
MTLVEIIVAFVIAAILISASSALIISSTNLVAHATNKTMDESIADAVLTLTTQQLLYALSVSVVSPDDSGAVSAALASDRTVVYIGDESGAVASGGRGVLWFKRFDAGASERINIFGASFYHGRSIALQYRVDRVAANETKAVTATVLIYNREGEQTLKRSTSLQLLNAQTTDASTMLPPLTDDTGRIYYDPPAKALILAIEEPMP